MVGKSIKYFPGLNALRFIAAACVIITHVELLKGAYGFEHSWDEPILQELGSLGVSFFFVLSGFLITYLLLAERHKSGGIKIKHFYMRRILRIWPLYYVLFLLGFLVLPNIEMLNVGYLEKSFEENYWGQFWSYVVILPNLGYALYNSPVPHIGQLWSIGVEEQFYLFWPLIVRYFKNLQAAIWYGLGILIFVKVVVLFLSLEVNSEAVQSLKTMLAMSKFENMLIGALGAIFVFNSNDNVLKFLNFRFSAIISLALIIIMVYATPPVLQNGIHIVNSVLFLSIILNIIKNTSSKSLLELPFLRTLGDISYGIYMYHMIVVAICLVSFKYFHPAYKLSWLSNLLIYLSSFTLTILISLFSYEKIEKPFLKLKGKFNTL